MNDKKDQEGVLLSAGNQFGGYVLYIKDNRLKYVYNYNREQEFVITSKEELPEGKLALRLNFVVNSKGTVDATIFVNGIEQGSVEITGFIAMMETHVFLKDGGNSAVTDDYTLPFEYPETLDLVQLEAASYLIDSQELLQEFFEID